MNFKDLRFRVANFPFVIVSDKASQLLTLLPSFAPFVERKENANEESLFSVKIVAEKSFDVSKRKLVEQTYTNIGDVKLYADEVSFQAEITTNGAFRHQLYVMDSFAHAEVVLHLNDPLAGQVLSIFIRMVFSQAILMHQAVSLHAAVVVKEKRAYLFMGKSGTGKSTHARLWMQYLKDVTLLNDDNPTMRINKEQIMVYGTPWSGKTPCYKNESFPVGGIVRLQQSLENRFSPQNDVSAFTTLLPGCAVFPKTQLQNNLYDTLSYIVSRVKIGQLHCLPNEDAAKLCATSLGA